eukprot:GHVP01054041.1.p1 GENE.GHVP01054041.1~~GHVP01054041.1.p1  ORF type:complete len:152 (-),score=36.06 GHVP01054041.1:821-1276(-)
MKDSKDLDELFGLFDVDQKGYIDIQTALVLIRATNRSPTDAEAIGLLRKDEPQKEKITKEDIKELMTQIEVVDKKKAREELLEAFQIFDNSGNGVVLESELRHILTSIGEKMTDDDVNKFLSGYYQNNRENNTGGNINYKVLIEYMLGDVE